MKWTVLSTLPFCRFELSVIYKNYIYISFWEVVACYGRHLCVTALLICLVAAGWRYKAPTVYLTIGLLSVVRLSLLRFTFNGYRNAVSVSVTVDRVQVDTKMLETDNNSSLQQKFCKLMFGGEGGGKWSMAYARTDWDFNISGALLMFIIFKTSRSLLNFWLKFCFSIK